MMHNWDVILSEGESYTAEFKESPDKELPSEVCALANAVGGKVYIGIHDDGFLTTVWISSAPAECARE